MAVLADKAVAALQRASVGPASRLGESSRQSNAHDKAERKRCFSAADGPSTRLAASAEAGEEGGGPSQQRQRSGQEGEEEALDVGQRVKALFGGGIRFFPGRVAAKHADGS